MSSKANEFFLSIVYIYSLLVTQNMTLFGSQHEKLWLNPASSATAASWNVETLEARLTPVLKQISNALIRLYGCAA